MLDCLRIAVPQLILLCFLIVFAIDLHVLQPKRPLLTRELRGGEGKPGGE